MKTFEVFRFAVLFQLSAYSAAAPPLAHPASSPFLTLVSPLTQLENATQHLNSTGASNSGVNARPPPQSLIIRVKNTDISLRCHGPEDVNWHRDEEWVEEALDEAFRDTASHREQLSEPLGTGPRRYQSEDPAGVFGETEIFLRPQADMTWGMWKNALVGIQLYAQRYPGFDFQFDVLVDGIQHAVGKGGVITT